MAVNFEEMLDKEQQSALASEIVTATVAVVSNASAPDFAVHSLEQGVSAALSPQQRDAAFTLQAYGAGCASEVFAPALDASASERAEMFRAALGKKCPDGMLNVLDKQPEAAAAFKSRMCHAIASKCAELAAADIDRLKKGKITILNAADQQVFEAQHKGREQKQAQAAIAFLSSLPKRFPSFGVELFKEIRQAVQHEIEENYKSPDIHDRVDSLFRDALEAMPLGAR